MCVCVHTHVTQICEFPYISFIPFILAFVSKLRVKLYSLGIETGLQATSSTSPAYIRLVRTLH